MIMAGITKIIQMTEMIMTAKMTIMVKKDVIWYHKIYHNIILYDMIGYDIAWYDITCTAKWCTV